MEFQDFPRFLGKSGKYEIHLPKLCAGIIPTDCLRTPVQDVEGRAEVAPVWLRFGSGSFAEAGSCRAAGRGIARSLC